MMSSVIEQAFRDLTVPDEVSYWASIPEAYVDIPAPESYLRVISDHIEAACAEVLRTSADAATRQVAGWSVIALMAAHPTQAEATRLAAQVGRRSTNLESVIRLGLDGEDHLVELCHKVLAHELPGTNPAVADQLFLAAVTVLLDPRV